MASSRSINLRDSSRSISLPLSISSMGSNSSISPRRADSLSTNPHLVGSRSTSPRRGSSPNTNLPGSTGTLSTAKLVDYA